MAETKKKEDNTVFIGSKPFMNYVRAVEIQFNQNNKEVLIRSRGKFISRAVDVEQVIKHGPLGASIETKRISTNSEEFQNQEGKKVKVSTIEIALVKK